MALSYWSVLRAMALMGLLPPAPRVKVEAPAEVQQHRKDAAELKRERRRQRNRQAV